MAKTLHVTVSRCVATYSQRDGYIVCGNSGYKIQFTFDSEWDDDPVKVARFISRGVPQDVIFVGNTVSVPVMTNTESVTVGVFSGNLQTTTSAVIPCQRSILCPNGAPADPVPDVYAQIIDLLNSGYSNGAAIDVGPTEPTFPCLWFDTRRQMGGQADVALLSLSPDVDEDGPIAEVNGTDYDVDNATVGKEPTETSYDFTLI